MHDRSARLALVLFVMLGVPGPALADILQPGVVGAAVDTNNDGIGDVIDPRPLITNFPPSPRFSTILEYDVNAFHLHSLSEGRLAGTIFTNNFLDTGPRTFDIQLFAGNGALDASDFHAPGISVGMVTYHPPTEANVPFSFDVLAQVQALVDAGATHVGARIAAVNLIAPSALDDRFPPTLTIAGTPAVVPEPSALALLGVGIVGVLGYGRRKAWRRVGASRATGASVVSRARAAVSAHQLNASNAIIEAERLSHG
jgi:hypothetical protein